MLRYVTPLALLVAGFYAASMMALQHVGFADTKEDALIAATGFVTAKVYCRMGLGIVRGLGKAVRAQVFDGL